ncbi:TSCPD domain-containing protein [Candidatus Pacearchaeota archaeon]|jgi:ribonucleoside-diphosphate reductase alpha chain|nr:TSCPD domain-containing protein [Candidatus Pacearchaeota archaeon]
MAKKERDKVLFGITRKTKTGCGNAYITINYSEGKPVEVMMRLGKAGTCPSTMGEAIGKMISTALQHEAELIEIAKDLKGIQCLSPTFDKEDKNNTSCIDALGKCLEEATKEEIKTRINSSSKEEKKEVVEKIEEKK